MNKKRALAQSRFVELAPHNLAALYGPRRVKIDQLLNQLEDLKHDYIEEALQASDYRDAKEVLKHIMEKK